MGRSAHSTVGRLVCDETTAKRLGDLLSERLSGEPEVAETAIAAFEAALEAGITLYDHADIYGGGSCEEVFKDCLTAVPGCRERIVIATKGGIRQGYYDLSAPYLTGCVERSLNRMGIEYIDLYQLHRPDPLTHPATNSSTMKVPVSPMTAQRRGRGVVTPRVR